MRGRFRANITAAIAHRSTTTRVQPQLLSHEREGGPDSRIGPRSIWPRPVPGVWAIEQIEANRRNALKSTGPKTESGKEISRQNAVRHGLTAETVITALEDAEDYQAFEAAITADYDAQSTVERELVLRLASILWRLRRATTIETGLFKIQAEHLRGHQQ